MSTPEPDYKKLFELTLYHLRCVSGSRNSFTPEANRLLFSERSHALLEVDGEAFRLRSPEVDRMHNNAVEWLHTMKRSGFE